MYEHIFEAIGLNEHEATIYEILINNGPSEARSILKLVDLTRSNVYNVLSGLQKKGLIIENIGKNQKKLYRAEPPDKLEGILVQKDEAIKQSRREFDAVLPLLKDKFQAIQEKPIVKYYFGAEEIKKIYEETIKTGDKEIQVLTSFYGNVKMKKYLLGYMDRRAKKNITTKIISNTDDSEIISLDNKLNKTRKYNNIALPTEIDIFDDKVALISYRNELVGMIIENEDFAETMKKVFKSLWDKL